jgi:hypothetical protein
MQTLWSYYEPAFSLKEEEYAKYNITAIVGSILYVWKYLLFLKKGPSTSARA